MIEAFAAKNDDASRVAFVLSDFCARKVVCRLTRVAAQAARAAKRTAAEFAEARSIARAQLDAWPPFAATTGHWTRERTSSVEAVTDVELEGGPLLALGLALPALVGAAGAPAPPLHGHFTLPGCEMTEVRKKRICVLAATEANKKWLLSVFSLRFRDDFNISEAGPIRWCGDDGIDMEAWVRSWPTTPPPA